MVISNMESAEIMDPESGNEVSPAKPISLDTLEELRQENKLNGFLYFPRFLSEEEIGKCLEIMHRLDQTIDYTWPDKPRKPGDPFEVRNLLAAAPELVEFVDREPVLLLMSHLMGANIQICNTQAFIKPGFPPGTTMQQQKRWDGIRICSETPKRSTAFCPASRRGPVTS
jgi:hypothetical protein